jgi:hypothetical protein
MALLVKPLRGLVLECVLLISIDETAPRFDLDETR